MKNPFKKQPAPAFPQYYRHGDTIVRVDADQKYTVMLPVDGRIVVQERDLQLQNYRQVFVAPDWKLTDETDWIRARDRGVISGPGTAPAMEYVTTIAGKAIYQYKTIEDMPVGRLKEGEIIFMELKAAMEWHELRSIITAVKAVLNPNKEGVIEIDRAQGILTNLLNRMDVTYNFSIFKKLCGFWFIEEGEDVAQYNPKEAKEKVKRWEAAGGMAFFFALPLSEFLPSDPGFTTDSEGYLRTMQIRIESLKISLERLMTT